MEGVLHGPVAANGPSERFCIGRDAGQEEAGFASRNPVDFSQTFNHAEAAQAFPEFKVLEPFDFLRDPVAAGFYTSMVFFHRLQKVVRDTDKVLFLGIEQEAADLLVTLS